MTRRWRRAVIGWRSWWPGCWADLGTLGTLGTGGLRAAGGGRPRARARAPICEPPRPARPPAFIPQIRLYQDWLRDRRGLRFDSYDALWRWSTTELDAFWQSIWDYFDLQSPTPHSAVLASNRMPGAQWFPGAQVNYARQALRHVAAAHASGQPAIISRNEKGRHRELSWPELQRQVAALALHLQAQGVQPGDRVAAY